MRCLPFFQRSELWREQLPGEAARHREHKGTVEEEEKKELHSIKVYNG